MKLFNPVEDISLLFCVFLAVYISFVFYLFRINKIPADKMRSPLAAQICHFFAHSAEARFEELSLWCLTQHPNS